jgi:pimeloyl-ACP methyl ester carboxylesterase
MSRSGAIALAVLLVALLAGAFGVLRFRQDLAHARELALGGSRIIDTVAGPIEYAERGAGVPLLSIHGAGGGYDQGLANAADLVGEGFHVVAPSRFGYLRTPIPADASPAAQADAHAALLSGLKVPRAVVVGISAGARSALELAIRYPHTVSALVLIVPGTYAPSSPVAVEGSRGSRLVFRVVNAGADFAWWAAGKLTPSVLIRFIGVPPELVAAAPEAQRQRVMAIVRSIQPLSLRFPGINIDSNPNLRELPLEKIAAPTLIVSARDDLFNTLPAARHAAGRIPGADLVVYDTGGHLLVGREREVRDAVRAFLARHGLVPAASQAAAPPR